MLTENDRLTHEHANGWLSSTGKRGPKYWSSATKAQLIDRLGQYEDSGLEPLEVLTMKADTKWARLMEGVQKP